MRNNIVTAIAGEKPYIKTDPVFQYDYGQMLVIEGVTLPESYEVQFGNTKGQNAKTVTGDSNGVAIPDEYLVNGEDIHAYLYLHSVGLDDDGETVYHIQIPVMHRHAIAEEQISPVEHNVIREALEKLQEAVAETEQNVENYPYIADDHYWMVYDATSGQFVNTGVKANGERFEMGIGEVTTLPAGADATASLTWIGEEALLNLGLPAGDASSMVSVHRECSSGNPIVINDGADNISLDEMRIIVKPAMEGSGIPSPTNIRRITGVDNITITHNLENRLVEFGDEVGIIYGGTYYPLTGRLVVDRVFITKNCAAMDNTEVQPGWRNSGISEIVGTDVAAIFTDQTLNIGTSFGVDTTNGNDLLYLGYDQYHLRQQDWVNSEITVQICVPMATPIEYQIDPISITTALGNNTYSVDHGNIAYMKYPCDTKLFIEYAIANSGYYTKPIGGIPKSDLANAVVSEIAGKIDSSAKGAAGGVAELDLSGKVLSTQLPSYVDDILEYTSISQFPQYGESGKIYVADDTNKTYRWGGNGYVEISESLALGETGQTAYRGDRGKVAYEHATDSGKIANAQVAGLYKIAVTAEGHIASVSAVTASDIIALGIIDDTAGAGDTNKILSADKVMTALSNKADKTDTVLTSTLSRGRKEDTTVGEGSVAFGYSAEASGAMSQATGLFVQASGLASHAENNDTHATGDYSHAEGSGSNATGSCSHSEGYDSIAAGAYSHAEGSGSQTASGAQYGHAEGGGTHANAPGAHSEGLSSVADGYYSHAEGDRTHATGDNSHSEGSQTLASGQSSHAEGVGGTFTLDGVSHTSEARGTGDHVEGYQCETEIRQPGNHAEGYRTQAIGGAAHSEGSTTVAKGANSHAEGFGTISGGYVSHAEGYRTIASGDSSHVSGRYNVEDDYSNWEEWVANKQYHVGDKVKVTSTSDSSTYVTGYICNTDNSDSTFDNSHWTYDTYINYAEIIGNGTEETRSNARTLDWDGNERIAGDLYVKCNNDSTGGEKVAVASEKADIIVAYIDNVNIANIRDGSENDVKELVLKLNPIQGGSGDPYPAGGGKNIFPQQTVSGTGYVVVENLSIPAGTYTISAIVTSSDTDYDKCLVSFYNGSTSMTYKYLSRGDRSNQTITVASDITAIYFYASDSAQHSTGDTFTFDNIQLESGSTATDYATYSNIRTIGGQDAVTLYNDPVYGGCIVWNQQVDGYRANQASIDVDGLTVTPTAQSGKAWFGVGINSSIKRFTTITDHVYMIWYTLSDVVGDHISYVRPANGTKDMTSGLGVYHGEGEYAGVCRGKYPGGDMYINWGMQSGYTTVGTEHFTLSNTQIFDLTLIFGAEEANRIYSMENSSAGSGVAYFRSLFPNYPYGYTTRYRSCVSAINDMSFDQIYPVTLPTTVYGGEIDWVRGKLKITKAIYTFTGNESFERVITPNNISPAFYYFRLYSTHFTSVITDWNLVQETVMSNYPTADGLTYWYSGGIGNNINAWTVASQPGVCIRDDRYDNASDFKASMAGNTIAYNIVTPIEYNLSDLDLIVLTKGENKVWIDAGVVKHIEYKADTKMYVDHEGVHDVQIDGTSITQNGVANIPKATNSSFGVTSTSTPNGLNIGSNGAMRTYPATDSDIKAGTQEFRPIVAKSQHQSVFYGLAKAAGNSDQSSSANAVGVYTPDALLKIQQMLGLWTPKIYMKYTIDEDIQSINSDNFPFNDTELNIYEELVLCIYQSDTTQTAYGSNDYGYFTIRDAVNSGYINVGSLYLKTTKQCSIMRVKRLPYAVVAELINDGSTYMKAFPRSLDYVDKIRWISASVSNGTFKAGTTIETYISRFY